MIPGPIIEELNNLELRDLEVPQTKAGASSPEAKAMPKAKAAALSRRFRLLGKPAPSGWYQVS